MSLYLIKNKLVIKLWSFIYKKWLWSDFYKEYGTVIAVKGWRTAIADIGASRMTITPCFLWFK